MDVTQDTETGLYGVVREPKQDGLLLTAIHVNYEDLTRLPETYAEAVHILSDAIMDTDIELLVTSDGVHIYPDGATKAQFVSRLTATDTLDLALKKAINDAEYRETEKPEPVPLS